jgi:hypothetical protein
LMLAFLDHWLGQRPVSEDLKRDLLGTINPTAFHRIDLDQPRS